MSKKTKYKSLVAGIHQALMDDRYVNKNGRKLRMSDAGAACQLRLAYEVLGVEAPGEVSPDQLMVFTRGDVTEEHLRKYLKAAFGKRMVFGGECKVCKAAGRPGRFGIHCELNGYIGHADIELDKKAIVDIKSTGPKTFNYYEKHGPSEGNVMQVRTYMAARKREHGALLYVCMDSGRMQEFWFKQDMEAVKKKVAEFDQLVVARGSSLEDLDTTPPHRSPNSFPCSYEKYGVVYPCPYWETCHGGGKTALVPELFDMEATHSPTLADFLEARTAKATSERSYYKTRDLLMAALQSTGHSKGKLDGQIIQIQTVTTARVDQDLLPADVKLAATTTSTYEKLDVRKAKQEAKK